jgi:AcrR family transcriptional regulator
MSKLLNRPRKSPKQERSTELVSAIYEASVRILTSPKKLSFTTRQVADIAGISVGSIYQYFPNKQALIGALIERETIMRTQQIKKKYAEIKNENIEVIVHDIVFEILQKTDQDKKYLRGIYRSIFEVDRLETLIEQRELVMQFVAELLLHHKVLKNAEQAQLKAYCIVTLLGGVIETLIFRKDERVSVKQLTEEVTSLILK